MRCPACDQENSPDVRFCTGCGTLIAPVTWAQPASAPPYATPYAPLYPGQGAPGTYAPGYADTNAAYPAGARQPPYAYQAAAGQPNVAYQAGAGQYNAAYAPYGYAPGPQIVNNISVAAQAPASVIAVMARGSAGPPLLLRLLYFLFVGLWLGALWTVLSWLLVASLIGLPLGLYMLNRLPLVMTLKPPETQTEVSVQNGLVVIRQGAVPQLSLALRAPYFLLVGWWASLVWLLLTWLLILGTLGFGLPIAFWMVNRVPAITTLAR